MGDSFYVTNYQADRRVASNVIFLHYIAAADIGLYRYVNLYPNKYWVNISGTDNCPTLLSVKRKMSVNTVS